MAGAVFDVAREVVREQAQRALQRLHGARRQITEALVRLHEPDALGEDLEVAGLPAPVLDVLEQRGHPLQALAAWRAPAARLLGEELQHVGDHADGAGLVVEKHHGAGTQAALHLAHRREAERHVDLVGRDEERGGAAGADGA